jgi:transcriptional regulator with XRE-family HTH domain
MTDAKGASTQRSPPRERDVWKDVRAMQMEPRAVNVAVGLRIKQRRMRLKLTQDDVAKAIGVDFKQICRYEKGEQQISVGRIYQLSVVLNAPVAHFFQNAPHVGTMAATLPDDDDRITEFLASVNGLAIVKACARLDEGMRLVVRRHVERLARAFAD